MIHSIARRLRAIVGLCVLALAGLAAPAAWAKAPIEVRVVIVTTWEETKDGKDVSGELHAWLTKWPLKTQIAFPVGVRALSYDPRSHVLAILTGEATARAAASIMALGCDRRFDLSHAYWIVTGTAGVDPKIASVGSAAWSRWVVDGDLAQELDARDMPSEWSTGFVPYGRTEPYQQPAPPAETESGHLVYALNRSLVDWAYARTRDVALHDDPTLVKLRAPYAGPATRPPFVLEGEGLMSARTWYGARFNEWAEKWVDYWTGGQGQFAMSAEEDAGILQALTFLAHAKRVRLDRVLVLRAGSDYSIGPPELTAAQFLAKEAKEGFPATPEALDSLYAVASPIARALADDWATTRDHVPGAAR